MREMGGSDTDVWLHGKQQLWGSWFAIIVISL